MVCMWIFLSHAVILELTLYLYKKLLFFPRTEQETRNVQTKVLTRCFYKKFHETVASNKGDVKHFP